MNLNHLVQFIVLHQNKLLHSSNPPIYIVNGLLLIIFNTFLINLFEMLWIEN